MDEETLHQLIYKNVHQHLQEYIDSERMANAIWLGTEDAAKAVFRIIEKK